MHGPCCVTVTVAVVTGVVAAVTVIRPVRCAPGFTETPTRILALPMPVDDDLRPSQEVAAGSTVTVHPGHPAEALMSKDVTPSTNSNPGKSVGFVVRTQPALFCCVTVKVARGGPPAEMLIVPVR